MHFEMVARNAWLSDSSMPGLLLDILVFCFHLMTNLLREADCIIMLGHTNDIQIQCQLTIDNPRYVYTLDNLRLYPSVMDGSRPIANLLSRGVLKFDVLETFKSKAIEKM